MSDAFERIEHVGMWIVFALLFTGILSPILRPAISLGVFGLPALFGVSPSETGTILSLILP